MEIKIVKYGSEDYRKCVGLREKILRIPLGLRFTPEYLEQDRGDIHIAAFDGDKVIGTVVIKIIDQKTVKIRQVAVETLLQGHGIGTELMKFAEDYAKKHGFEHAFLHARFYTVAFYRKLGYKITSGPFMEIGMEHYRMDKSLKND